MCTCSVRLGHGQSCNGQGAGDSDNGGKDTAGVIFGSLGKAFDFAGGHLLGGGSGSTTAAASAPAPSLLSNPLVIGGGIAALVGVGYLAFGGRR